MSNIGTTIYENNMYNVSIERPIFDHEDKDDFKVYAVINKETGVRESETTVLLQAKMEADGWKVKNGEWRGEAEFQQQVIEPAGGFNPRVVN